MLRQTPAVALTDKGSLVGIFGYVTFANRLP